MTTNEWEIEEILDDNMVFRRVHINDLINWPDLTKIQPNIFRSDPDGMSVNWNKYATAKETLGADNSKNGVIQMIVNDIGKEPEPLEVKHTPTFENRAHASVLGIVPSTKTKSRKKLASIAEWAIQPNFNN
jgi:hypothetical protein